MNKSKNHSDKIFSWKAILAYLKYDRKGKDAHELEKAASEDPFLSDAIDGYEAFKHDPIHTSRLKDIEDYIQYRKSQEKAGSGNSKRILAIAASITVLVSGSLWVRFSLIEPGENQKVVDIPNKIPDKEETIEPEIIQDKTEKLTEPIASEKGSEEASELEETNSEIETEGIEERESNIFENENDDLGGAKLLLADEDTFLENTDKKNNYEFYSEDLINRILAIEMDFWNVQEANQLAMSDVEQGPVAEDAAPANQESIRSERKESKPKKVNLKKRKAAGAASSEPTTINETVKIKAPISIPDIVDSLRQKKEVSKLDSIPFSNDIHLIKSLNYLYKKDTSRALIQLKQASPRNQEQRVLIDSLIGHLTE